QFGVALRQQTELLPQRRVVGPWYLARRRLHHDRPAVRGEWPGLFDLLGERFALFWFARQLRGHPPGDVFLVKRAVAVPLVPALRLFLREFRVDRADAVNAEVAGGLARRPVIDHAAAGQDEDELTALDVLDVVCDAHDRLALFVGQ